MTVELLVEATSHLVHQHTGFDLSERYYTDPIYRLGHDQEAAAWARQRFPGFEVFIESGEFSANAAPVIRVGGLQPYIIISALFGAEIRFWDDHEPCIVEEPLKHVADLSSIEIPNIERHPFVQKLVEQVREMQRAHGGRMPISPPFFWDDSDWAFVHAPFTTAYKLRGERFFMELYSDPEGTHHLIDVAVQTISLLIDLFAGVGERRIKGIHLGDCAASLVSPKHYLQYAVPALERLIEGYGPARLHSCGPSTHLLSAFERIQGIQELHLGWDTDLGAARARLGDRQMAYLLPPAFLLQDQSQIEKQMRAALEANGDAPLIWWIMIDHGTPEDHLNLVQRIWQERSRKRCEAQRHASQLS